MAHRSSASMRLRKTATQSEMGPMANPTAIVGRVCMLTTQVSDNPTGQVSPRNFFLRDFGPQFYFIFILLKKLQSRENKTHCIQHIYNRIRKHVLEVTPTCETYSTFEIHL